MKNKENIIHDNHNHENNNNINNNNNTNNNNNYINTNQMQNSPKRLIIKENHQKSPEVHKRSPVKKSSNKIIDKGTKDIIFDKIDKYRKSEVTGGNLTYGCLDIIGMKLCCCVKKYSAIKAVIEKGEKSLNKYIDYLEIIKHIQNLEKLIKVLFDKSRLDLFNNAVKPRMFIKDEFDSEEESEQVVTYKDEKFNYYDLYSKYKHVKFAENEDKQQFDCRLLELFDNDIKMPFEILSEKEHKDLVEVKEFNE